MLVVTQKIRTAKGADRILLIDAGKVVAYGTHEELLETSSLYKNSYLSTGGGGLMGFFQKPFGYEPLLTKDDLKQGVKKKKGPRATDWKYIVAVMENCRRTTCTAYCGALISDD